MKHLAIIAFLALLNSTALSEVWEFPENGLVMITFGPDYDYQDDFILHKGNIEGSEWVFHSATPAQSTLVSTKKIGKKIGTDESRKFTIGAIAYLKFDWSGPCFVYSEAPAFFVDLTFENEAGNLNRRTYELAMSSLPNGLCRANGSAMANTDGKYEPYGLLSMDVKNKGPIRNIQISLRRAVKNTTINLQYFRLILGHGKRMQGFLDADLGNLLSPDRKLLPLNFITDPQIR